jgi:hypothetical protein
MSKSIIVEILLKEGFNLIESEGHVEAYTKTLPNGMSVLVKLVSTTIGINCYPDIEKLTSEHINSYKAIHVFDYETDGILTTIHNINILLGAMAVSHTEQIKNFYNRYWNL